MTSTDIVVLAGGDVDLALTALAGVDTSGTTVVAADSGVHLADALGLHVDVAVGDFDSIDLDRLAELERSDTEVRAYPSDKDAIDLALALDVALELEAPLGNRVLVAGIEGRRSDFVLANQLLISAERYRRLDRRMALVGAIVHVVTERHSSEPVAGTTLSVVPVHGSADVSFVGVRWPLVEATLEPGTTWALSNEAVGPVELTVHSGTALFFELPPT